MSTDLPPDPAPRERRLVGGPMTRSLRLRLMTTTPILGGSSLPRRLDAMDPIRAPSIRGQLRFWWRALYGHQWSCSTELARRERELWGGVGGEAGTRSRVEIRVMEVVPASPPQDSGDLQSAPSAYALWVANSQKTRGQEKPSAPRWRPGVCFVLHVLAPVDCFAEVECALRAWVLWGGYGSRTRRGLGSLTVVESAEEWLPTQPTRAEWVRLFPGLPLFGTPLSKEEARPLPLLRGARLLHGAPRQKAADAWEEPLGWLREFRQGQGPFKPGSRRGASKDGEGRAFARERKNARPGRSFWPEADKVRLLLPKPDGTQWAHPPRSQYASRSAAWPRAGFGLPLAIRFQRKDARGEHYAAEEPSDVELKWHDGEQLRDRLASPLIVKAMPLANGQFVPIALWLHRSWPAQGRVVLVRKGDEVRGSRAPFEPLLAPGDTALYAPLESTSLEEAFLSWVKGFREVEEVK